MSLFANKIKEMNKFLEMNELPPELNFSVQPVYDPVLDLNKIKYNSFYRSYGFYKSKFPNGVDSIAGFDKIIQSIVDEKEKNNVTPLDEIMQRKLAPMEELDIHKNNLARNNIDE